NRHCAASTLPSWVCCSLRSTPLSGAQGLPAPAISLLAPWRFCFSSCGRRRRGWLSFSAQSAGRLSLSHIRDDAHWEIVGRLHQTAPWRLRDLCDFAAAPRAVLTCPPSSSYTTQYPNSSPSYT